MTTKVFAISVGVLSVATSAVFAAGLTDLMRSERMTVAQVDRAKARFLCAEHRQWVLLSKADVTTLASGDIVRVEPRNGRLAKVTVLRTAADELSSPER
jgi:hypothetical protein